MKNSSINFWIKIPVVLTGLPISLFLSNTQTLNPCLANVRAEDRPANPAPTTMTSYGIIINYLGFSKLIVELKRNLIYDVAISHKSTNQREKQHP